jgi:hypothetical protein
VFVFNGCHGQRHLNSNFLAHFGVAPVVLFVITAAYQYLLPQNDSKCYPLMRFFVKNINKIAFPDGH